MTDPIAAAAAVAATAGNERFSRSASGRDFPGRVTANARAQGRFRMRLISIRRAMHSFFFSSIAPTQMLLRARGKVETKGSVHVRMHSKVS